MSRRSLMLWLGIPLLFACARHVVVERNQVKTLNDSSWRIENRPEAVEPTNPIPIPESQLEGNVEERLRQLARLRDKGLISEAEYQEKRANLLQQL